MNRLIAFIKKLRLRQIATVFLAGVLLVVSTACSSATTQGVNPNNPPVQAGGANNPYKSGGDAYTDLNKPTSAKSNPVKSDRASVDTIDLRSIAATENELLYPGAETPAGRAAKETELPIKTNKDFVEAEPGGLNQRNPDLGERVGNRVEAAKDAFKEASGFVKEKSDEAGRRPEFQSNPALHK